ncbi:MAG: hypothetical protein KDD62_03840, partial [Bdellovibrionales bacterium]|nr:hypothetical protein [Bdellovibrionales bacterium]
IIVYETLVEDFTEEKLLAAQQLLRAYGYFNFYLDPKLKRLLIAKYPALPEDCIAIHPRRMLSAAPLMHNCAQYEFSCPETIRIFGAPQQLTVIGVHKDLYCVALHPPHEDTMEMMLCERNEDTLSFVQTDNNTTRALHASAFVLPIDTEHAMHRDDTTIVVSSGGQTQKITGHLIDGVLYRY